MKKEKNIKNYIVENRKLIYAGLIGLGVGTLVTLSFYPERIAKLEDGSEVVATFNNSTITADNLYEDMKDEYAISALLNTIDSEILSSMYTITEDMDIEIEDTLEYYLNMYNSYYGYTEEEFLSANGFTSKEEFKDYLTIDYLRNLYYEDFAKEQITDTEINNYYKNSVYGAINTKYIAVDSSEDNAEELINEIIDSLNSGSSYDDVVDAYKDSITYADLGYVTWNSDIDTEYMDALLELKEDNYSKEYVTTTYGYTIIFRLDQKEKDSLETERDSIIEKLATELMTEDETLYYEALIKLRKENNLEFKDTVLENKYKAYCKQFE